MGRREKGMTVYSVCPRCGNIGYRYIESRGEREYIYYAHYDRVSKRVRKCYVGPLHSYEHAKRLLALGLSNIEDVDLLAVARRAIDEYVDRVLRSNRSDRARALEELTRLRELVDEKVKLLEESKAGGEE